MQGYRGTGRSGKREGYQGTGVQVASGQERGTEVQGYRSQRDKRGVPRYRGTGRSGIWCMNCGSGLASALGLGLALGNGVAWDGGLSYVTPCKVQQLVMSWLAWYSSWSCHGLHGTAADHDQRASISRALDEGLGIPYGVPQQQGTLGTTAASSHNATIAFEALGWSDARQPVLSLALASPRGGHVPIPPCPAPPPWPVPSSQSTIA